MVQRNQFSRYLASKLRIVCCNSIDLWCNHSRFTGLSYFYEASLSTNLKKRQHAEVSAADIAGDLDWKVCLAPIGCVQGGMFFFYIERESKRLAKLWSIMGWNGQPHFKTQPNWLKLKTIYPQNGWLSRRKFRSQTSDNMDRWKSRGGKSQRREEQQREDQRRERVRRKKLRCAKR